MRQIAVTTGVLTARLLSNGTVITSFTPDGSTTAMRPMRAKNIDTAEWDFTHTYGLTPEMAATLRSRIQRDGTASFPAML